MSIGAYNALVYMSTSDHAASPDQRRFRRYGVKIPCRVRRRLPRSSALPPEFEVQTLNVSRGGLFFLASAEWTIGMAIEFELDLPALVVRRPVKIQCRGTIARVLPQGDGRMGIGATIEHYKISRAPARGKEKMRGTM